MERLTIDICATCEYDQPGYISVIGTIPHCCDKHWHCEPGGIASDYHPKKEITQDVEAKNAECKTY